MSNPYIGEIRMFGGNFPPYGWAFCDGSLQAISENDALFNLLGTTYGGDGVETFGLPDLRGRVPVHIGGLNGNQYQLGEKAGTENVTLTSATIPAHSHAMSASTAAPLPATGPVDLSSGAYVPASPLPKPKLYNNEAPDTQLSGGSISAAGGSIAHDNMAPFQAVNFIIALYGIFPSPN
ncbi:phage tail protein [Oxalobacteraceae bacterium]|nr:phage tail protein [Oxalobacteraceae bacterium]